MTEIKKRAGRKLPKFISKEEFIKLLEFCKKERENFRKPRLQTLTPRGETINQYIIAMILGFGAGLRISEIVGYKQGKDFIVPPLSAECIESNFIRVLAGKGNKDRNVPLPSKIFRKGSITRNQLKRALPLEISRRSLQRYITAKGKQVLHKKMSFHTLRHAFITHCIESGLSLPQAQMLAGHSRLDTTGIYLHVNPSKALEQYEEAF